MEIRSDLKLTLKSSCDACTSSKVKCTGEDPCVRCVKKGISCFYSPKKKRGPLKKRERSSLLANQPMVVRSAIDGQNKQLLSLGSHERRSWSVFFTLYKHYAVSCSLFWFNRQLHKMRLYLLKQNKTDALKRLSSWMEALNIDEDELAYKVEACHIKIKEWGKEEQAKAEEAAKANNRKPIVWKDAAAVLNRGSPFHLRVHGEINAVSRPSQNSPLIGFEEDESVPYLKMKVDYTKPTADSEVHVNRAFFDLFGYGTDEIKKNLEESGGGFLPWAADLLSRILVQESDLLSFVQIIAIKFNSLGRPTEFPIVRNVPSVHVFNVHHKDFDHEGPLPCVIRCTHREMISDAESSLDVFMSFAPLMASQPAQPQVIPDRDITVIEDHIELPPKRVKNSAMYLTEGYEHDAPHQQDDGKGVIYDYNLAQQEIASVTKEGESMINHIPLVDLNPSVPNPPPIDFSFHSHGQGSHYDHSSMEHYVEPIYSSEEYGSSKVLENGTPESSSPYANVSGNDDEIIDSLPFVDSSDEESHSANADDGEWLDELLSWTGPAIPTANEPDF